MEIPYFYNTIGERGIKLDKLRVSAKNQEVVIMCFFMRNPNQDYTPVEAMRALFMSCPITSIRRAMTNLTKRGILDKTENKRMGAWGIDNFTWQLSSVMRQIPQETIKEMIAFFSLQKV